MPQYRTRDTSRYALRKRELVSYDESSSTARQRHSSPFPFHLLPREVRNMIYDLVVINPRRKFSLIYRRETAEHDDDDDCTNNPVVVKRGPYNHNMRHARLFRIFIVPNTQSVNLLRTCKWIWREAAPLLYGQNLRTDNLEVLARFLSLLRPELLRLLREVELSDGIRWHNTHRLHDVIQYLLQATALHSLVIHFPEEYYVRNPSTLRDFRIMKFNQAVFTFNVDLFNTQLGRVFAFCLYRKHLGVWMVGVYRSGGIGRLSQTFLVQQWQIRCLWSCVLGDRLQFWTLWSRRFWAQSPPVWAFFNETRCNRFRVALFAELDSLLSQRLRIENSLGASRIGRRTTIRSWQTIDIGIDLPICLIQTP